VSTQKAAEDRCRPNFGSSANPPASVSTNTRWLPPLSASGACCARRAGGRTGGGGGALLPLCRVGDRDRAGAPPNANAVTIQCLAPSPRRRVPKRSYATRDYSERVRAAGLLLLPRLKA